MDQGRRVKGAMRVGGVVCVAAALLSSAPSPALGRTFVLPHVLEKSGTINNSQNTFDTSLFAVYGASLPDTMVGGGAKVDLYLFDESEAPMAAAGGETVCNPCTLDFAAARKKLSIRIDDLITKHGPYDGVKLGYGILVVGGSDPDNVALQGFVVNSHTSAFDLSFHGMDPEGGGGGGSGDTRRTFVLPHVLEKSGRISEKPNTTDSRILLTYHGGLVDGSRPKGASVELYLHGEDSSLLVSAAGTPVCGPCTFALDGSNRRESILVENLIEDAGGFGPLGLERGYGIVKVGGADPGSVSLEGFVVNSLTGPENVSYLDLAPDEMGPDSPDSTRRTFVLPHIIEKSGRVSTVPESFDTILELTYAGEGDGGRPAEGASLDLYLEDEAGGPLRGAGGGVVCNPCSFKLDEQNRRQTVPIEGLIENAGGFDEAVKLGFGVLVVRGDAENVSCQGFVVNSHTSAFDLSFLNLEVAEIDEDAPEPRKTFVLPHILEKSGRISSSPFTLDTTIAAAYAGGLGGGGGGGGGGATLDLYLYDDATGALMRNRTGAADVCNPCTFQLDASKRKRSIVIDDLIEASGGFDEDVKLGFGVLVVGGADPNQVALQGFVVNSHTSPFDLSFANSPLQLMKSSKPPRPPFRRGDPNQSGDVDLSDAIYTLGCLFNGSECPACPDAADSNDDGMLDLSDGVHTLQYLFSGGEAPPAPGPDTCGEEPDGDLLEECVYERC